MLWAAEGLYINSIQLCKRNAFGGRGLLAGFNDADSLARHIMYVLNNPKAKGNGRKTLSVGKTMMWEEVANHYAQFFIDILEGLKPQGNMVL